MNRQPQRLEIFSTPNEAEKRAQARDRGLGFIRVDDVLQARSDIDATPDVCGVIGFDNVFAAVIESTVANDEACPPLARYLWWSLEIALLTMARPTRSYRQCHVEP